jgi:type VI secretion system protein VasJ
VLGLSSARDLSSLGKAPIRPDQPSGVDVHYDPLFDQLQTEIDRSALPSLAGVVDWEKVVALGADILSQKSKDLQVAGYLAVGLIHTRGIDGLALSLKIFRDLLEHHGAGLFPQRPRGRLRSIEWWLEKSEVALRLSEDTIFDAVQMDLMEENLYKVGQLLEELLPDAPSLQVLSGFLQRAARSKSTDNLKTTDNPETTDNLKTTDNLETVVAAAKAEEPMAEKQEIEPAMAEHRAAAQFDALGAVEAGLQRLQEAAAFLRDQDIANPLAYRFSRMAAWLGVTELPTSNDGLTLLAPPNCQLKNQLSELQHGGDARFLLQAVEGQLSQHIFWLDLNRLAAEALSGLGAGQAAAVVGQETALLLQRLPGLDRLAFADGTSFAGEETRHWLTKFQLCGRSSTIISPRITAANSQLEQNVSMSSEMDTARALIDEGQAVEALNLLQERLQNGKSERERLQWRLAFSRVLIDAGQTRFAIPILQHVVSDIWRTIQMPP